MNRRQRAVTNRRKSYLLALCEILLLRLAAGVRRYSLDLFTMGKTSSSPISAPNDSSPEDENGEEMDVSRLSTSSRLLTEHRKQRKYTHTYFRTLEGRDSANTIPSEVLVSILGFLDRDQLEVLQLVSGRFDILIDKYYKLFPLRQVQICKVESKKNGRMRLAMACFSEDRRPQNMIESNSDLHLWLRNCYIDTFRFIDFYFSDQILEQLKTIDTRTLIVKNCIFDYDRNKVKKSNSLKEEHLTKLFAIPAFKNCNGVIFSFSKSTVSYRPTLRCLLSLPLTTVVVDFDLYECTDEDVRHITKWLNDEPVAGDGNVEATSDPTHDDKPAKPSSWRKTKTLSLRDMEFTDDQFNMLILSLQEKFFADDARTRPFLLETEFYPPVNYNDVEGAHRILLRNPVTRESFEVRGNETEQATIHRALSSA